MGMVSIHILTKHRVFKKDIDAARGLAESLRSNISDEEHYLLVTNTLYVDCTKYIHREILQPIQKQYIQYITYTHKVSSLTHTVLY